MVREFYLLNEKGQQYSFMDIRNYCLLTDPSGLGYSYNREYEQIGNTFIETFGQIEQKQIEGTVNFLSYDNYKNLADFIERAEKLRILYKVPFEGGQKEYYKDVNIKELTKTQKQTNGILSETIIFDCLSLWYEENKVVYTAEAQEDEIRWDFKWDSRFADYDTRSLPYINTGHVEAPIIVSIGGHIINPKLELYVEGELVQEILFNVDIKEYEKILYGTKENEFYINKQNTDGTLTSLFSLDVIDFANDNVIRIPKNKSCELKISAENEVLNAEVIILPQYKIV